MEFITNRNKGRVLSGIYRLGEKSRVAANFLNGSGGMPPPGNVLK